MTRKVNNSMKTNKRKKGVNFGGDSDDVSDTLSSNSRVSGLKSNLSRTGPRKSMIVTNNVASGL